MAASTLTIFVSVIYGAEQRRFDLGSWGDDQCAERMAQWEPRGQDPICPERIPLLDRANGLMERLLAFRYDYNGTPAMCVGGVADGSYHSCSGRVLLVMVWPEKFAEPYRPECSYESADLQVAHYERARLVLWGAGTHHRTDLQIWVPAGSRASLESYHYTLLGE